MKIQNESAVQINIPSGFGLVTIEPGASAEVDASPVLKAWIQAGVISEIKEEKPTKAGK